MRRYLDTLRDERGSAVIVALLVAVLCLVLGGAIVATSVIQLRAGRVQRVRDSSFQLAEGALYAQGFLLPGNWPGTASRAFPASCSSAAATTPLCPDRNTLAAANSSNPSVANFSSADYQAAFGQACPTTTTAAPNVTCWTTEIRDDGAPLCTVFKASLADQPQTTCPGSPVPSSCPARCAWDANGNKIVWVYARGFVHGKARAVAAKLKLETLNEGLASAGLRVGHLSTSNNGNKTIIDASGAQVLVHCDPDSDSCVDTGKTKQITPEPTEISGQNTFMTASQLAHFKATAIADGRYYSGCPDDLSGRVVWVENCSTGISNTPSVRCDVPTQNGNATCINTPAGQLGDCGPAACAGMLGGPGPGLLIWHHGTLSLGGNVTYVGTIYMPNGSDDGIGASSGTIFSTGGTAAIYGSLAVDGDGGAVFGASGENFVYDSNSSGVFKSYGTAGLVQNTWQELPVSGG